jgi:uncharacterized protein (TIGR03437 family)
MTFDSCVGHQPGNGQYHYHANPLCLRAQLNDNVEIVRSSRTGATYRELKSGWHHSPILGWALDGYPIYGPYGYSDPKDSSSSVRRIKSGFRLRDIAKRTSLPDWSMPNHANIPQNLAQNQYGPDVSAQFPIGRYVEDYEWVSGAGDLDQYNGRVSVTPEYPTGTYAYYVTLDDQGGPAFPFIIAGQFYGSVAQGSFTANGAASASDYFNGGSYTAGPSSPALTSWATENSSDYARSVSGYDPSAGPQTTWPGTTNNIGGNASGSVTTPTFGDIQRIRYTDTTVYASSTGLASGYAMGPWFSCDMPGGVFINFPSASNVTFQLPRNPAAATNRSATGMGAQGMWVNGVVMFNFLDGASYINATGADAQVGNTPALDAMITSAASFEQGPQAPGSLVTAWPQYFSVLATATESASTPDWPETLGGATVQVRDSSGTTKAAQLSYASPGQINFRMPAPLASGAATVVIQAGGKTITSRINIQPVYPSLFMADETARAAGSTSKSGSDVYLTLYGSGLGGASSVTATIGGVPASVSYAGAQGSFAGLDQFNILVPPSVLGRGKVDVVVTANGKASNPVNVVLP